MYYILKIAIAIILDFALFILIMWLNDNILHFGIEFSAAAIFFCIIILAPAIYYILKRREEYKKLGDSFRE